MTKLFSFLISVLCFTCIRGQNLTVQLVKEEHHQVFRDLNDSTTLLDGHKINYQYDDSRRVIRKTVAIYHEGQYALNEIEHSEYDEWGNISFRKTEQFNLDNSLSSPEQNALITTTNTYNVNQLRSTIVSQHFFDQGAIDSFWYEYDNSSQLTLYRRLTFTDYSNYRDQYNFYKYNADGCLIETKDSIASVNNDFLELYWLKNKTTYHPSLSCEIASVDLYVLDSENQPELKRSWITDIELNTLGQLVRRETRLRSLDRDTLFRPQYSEQLSYNQYGDISFHETIYIPRNSIDRRRYTIERNQENLLTFRFEEYSDDPNDNWIPFSEQTRKYDDQNRIIEKSLKENWNRSQNKFDYSELDIINFEGNLKISDVTEVVEENNGLTIFSAKRERKYDHGCDDRLVQEMTNIENTIGISLNPSRTTYTYFDSPDCQNTAGKMDQLHIFPNPVINFINLETNRQLNNPSITVYNSKGQLFVSMDGAYSNFWILDLQTLPPGLYYANISTEEFNGTQAFYKY